MYIGDLISRGENLIKFYLELNVKEGRKEKGEGSLGEGVESYLSFRVYGFYAQGLTVGLEDFES